MNFLMMALAVVAGIEIWHILRAVAVVAAELIRQIPKKKQERKIGFDGAESRGKTTKDITMRRIGFGAND